MSNNCVILIPEEVRQTKFYKLLEKRCDHNDTQIIRYFCEVANNNGFKKEFTDWYKDYRKKDEIPTFDNINSRTIINDVIKYYYREHPDGKTTVMKDHKVVIGSYNSASDRQECILHLRSELKDIAQYHELVVRDNKNISFDKLCDLSIERMREHLVQRLCNVLGIDRKTLNTKLNQKRANNALYWYYKDENGPSLNKQKAANYATCSELISTARDLLPKDINIQDKNLLATLEEMIDYSKNADGKYRRDIFFDKVFEDNDLYRYKVKLDEFNEAGLSLDNSAIAISEGEEVSEDGLEIPLYIDETIKNYSSHLGEYSSFMMGISTSIQTYFNSLPVCRTTNYTNGKYDYDVDNAIGLPTKMTARNVAGILYSRAKLDGNIKDFVNSIKIIAETTPGYEGLIKLYNDLNGYNETIIKSDGSKEIKPIPPKIAFAEELYDTFARAVFAKKEIYIDAKGNVKARITNNMSSPRDSFILQLQRSVRYNAVRIEPHEGRTRLDELRKEYNTFKELKDKDSQEYIAQKNALANSIYNTFRWYYSDIDLSAILGFIDNNEHIDNKTNKKVISNVWNINKLISLIDYTVDNAEKTKKAYDDRNSRANTARYNNAINGTQTDIDEIYKEEFVSNGTKQAAIEVADVLLNYSVVKTQFNSRNAAGNTSSDILNNNMLSFMKKLIENTANTPGNKLSPLQLFANYKFKTAQYDESNVLIEHRNEDGKIINLGLFKKVVKQNPFNKKYVTLYEPTEYATDLLRVYLFNGANDVIKQKSALYAQMFRSDYLISSLASFYNPERTNSIENIEFADYYLRTPSDASHNFYISAPKHSIKGLFIIDDMSIIDNDINRRISELPKTNKYIGGNKSKIVDNTVFLKLLTGQPVDRIYLDDKMFIRRDEKSKDVGYAVISNRNSDLIIKGKIEKRGENSNYIHNIELVGILENNNHKGLSEQVLHDYKEYYKEKLRNNIIKIPGVEKDIRRINHNHPIFQQLFNVAKQEVTNAGLALTTLFEQHNSIDEITKEEVTTFVDNNTLTWKGKFAKSDDPDSMTEMYYHHDKGKPVFYKDKDGVIKLTGKVFTSDRFKKFSDIFEDENENKHYNIEANYLENLFDDGRAEVEDGHIHLLYGGANTHLHIDKDGNVELTKAQTKYIQSRIDKFILDYVDATYQMINEYEDIIPDSVPHDYEHVAEYILNYRLAYCAFADLFEGDTKCYKDFTDFFKRAKEVQGSGVPCSALDFTRIICENRELIEFSSLNKNETIKALNDAKKLHDCYLYNTFRGVTVYNTVRTSENTQNNLKNYLKEVIIKTYKENGIVINDEAINNKIDDMMDGFKDIKTNDAQSYITFEEWIRRISMRGQLPKYLPLIERICNEDIPLTQNDINEFIQVQKNFYYDMYNDRVTNHMRPRQIKNAEFVLVPRLVKGTQLEEVYNAMIRHGIDQLNTVETSKAGKSNILTLWDNKGNLNENWFDEKNEKFFNKVQDSIELFDYNFLYTQQETPQHVNAENKASIQIMKRSVDNIPHYINGKEHPLWNLKQKFYKYYAHNINESNRDLLEKLGIKGKITDDANFSGLDAEVFLDMIRTELFRNSVDSELSDYATLNTSPVERIADFQSFGLDTVMPLIANYSIQRKLENSSQALFNNAITRQTLPGFHAAQITSIGWNNTKKATYFLNDKYKNKNNSDLLDEISYKTWIKLSPEDRSKYIPDNGIGTSKDLKYHPALYKHKRTGIIIKEELYDTLSKDEKKSYEFHSSEPHIEVRVPKSIFNLKLTDNEGKPKSDEELLGELQQAGLDEFIGYRIPTEGKESIAVMKIVGFVDDIYGSTIVVPDDWVAQTGSDFDIDSVYAIVFNNYIDKKGNIKKDKVKIKFNELDYISYINRRLHNKIQDIKEVKEAKKAIFDNIIGNQQIEYAKASEITSEAYNNLPENVKDIVKDAQKKADNNLDKYEFFLQQLNFVISDLNSYLKDSTINEEERRIINEFIDSEQNLLSIVKDNNESLKSIHSKQSNYLKDIITNVESNAKKLNLPTYKEYLELDNIEKNNRKANTNELIETMLDILRSDYSLEETLGQSNFREIKKAMEGVVSKRNSIAKKARSPYDFIAQADNMEDGISGLALKGVSVAYDNTISMCNNARPLLTYNNEIKIIYDTDLEYPIDDKGNTEHKIFNIQELHKRFDTEEVDKNGQKYIKSNVEEILDEYGNPTGKVLITHKQYGWTNDNRSLFGFIITSYAAQTTAHQLDAVKEGKVPNVNLYTFGVYKMFPAIGSDYHTCIAFMNQPAITEIVNAYNMSKSIYVSGYTDPIQKAIVNIAKRIDPNIKYYSEAESLIENTIKTNKLNDKFIINYRELKNRIDSKTDNNNLQQIIYDYNVVKQFEKLKQTADAINAYGFVINPDKYGAKQTIFETNQVLTKIEDIILSDNPVFGDVENPKGDRVNFLDAIFPGISSVAFMDDDKGITNYLNTTKDEDSICPPMNAFMRCATVPSIIINKRLFKTQSPKFRKIVNALEGVMSGKNPRISKETEDSFTNYIISYVTNNVDIISSPIEYEEGNNIFIVPTHNIVKYNEGVYFNRLKERNRIYGCNYGPNYKYRKGNDWIDFNPKDKEHLTQEEINIFLKFSPAQKVAYVQQLFSNSLAAKYLSVDLTTNNKRNTYNPDGQVITFDEEKYDINEVRNDFRDMFFNENPLMRLTALDLIKYAYIVEGRSRKRNLVSKIIPNEVLLEGINEQGTGIVDSLKETWNTNIEISGQETIDNMVENYIRSHSNMKEISQCTINTQDMEKYFGGYNTIDDMLQIYNTEENHDFLLSKGFIYDDYQTINGEKVLVPKHNKYINITTYKNKEQVQTLYKIEKGPRLNQLILYPLNNLDPNEYDIVSSNPDNAKHYIAAYYKNILKKYNDSNSGVEVKQTLSNYYSQNVTDEMKKQGTVKKVIVLSSPEVSKKIDIYSDKEGIIRLRNRITEHFDKLTMVPLYLQNKELDNVFYNVSEIGVNGHHEDIELYGAYYRITKEKNSDYDIYKNRSIPVLESDIEKKPIIDSIRNYGGTFENIYRIRAIVTPNSNIKFSTIDETPIEESINNVEKYINTLAYLGDETARQHFKSNKKTTDTKDIDINTNLEKGLVNVLDWLNKEVNNTINRLEVFHNGHRMTDPEIFEEMLDNPVLARSYVKSYLDATRLIDRFKVFDAPTYKDKDQERLDFYVKELKKQIAFIENNDVYKKAEKLYVTEYLAKLSGNPNIKNNIISLYEGFHKVHWLDEYFNDLQDQGNPIIQLITSTVMADIRAKELYSKDVALKFEKTANELLAKAHAAGMDIDFDKFIDKDGYWINEFNNNLRSDLSILNSNIEKAYKEYSSNKGTMLEKHKLYEKYLDAQYELEKWLLKNINREAEDNYYQQLLQNKDNMRYDDGRFMSIYIQYEMLMDMKRNLQKQSDKDNANHSVLEKQIKDVERSIRNLIQVGEIDEFNNFTYKTKLEEINSDKPITTEMRINSYEEAEKLATYISNHNAIEAEYIDYKERDSFRNILEHNMAIINRYEQVDPITGIARYTATDLSAIPEYTNAKAWVRKNVIFKYGIETRDYNNMTDNDIEDKLEKYYNGDIKEDSEDFKYVLAAASKYFSGLKGSFSNKNSKYKTIAWERNARDVDGIIDGTKFTEDDLKIIKKEQLEQYNQTEDNKYSEKNIIHNDTNDDTIYNAKFYNNLKVKGIPNSRYQEIVKRINNILRRVYDIHSKKVKTNYLTESELEELLKQFTILKYNLSDDFAKGFTGLELLNYINNISENSEETPIKKKLEVNKYEAQIVANFIEKKVDFSTLTKEDKLEFDRQYADAKRHGEDSLYLKLWEAVNFEIKPNTSEQVQNHLLWGHLKPKKEYMKEYVHVKRTAATRANKFAFRKVNTKYYEQTSSNIIAKYGENSKEYKDWFELNHVYNPYTHDFEALPCWTAHDVSPELKQEAIPNFNMKTKSVREGHENPHYRKGLGYVLNYKQKRDREDIINKFKNSKVKRLLLKNVSDDVVIPDGNYDSNIVLSEYEEQMKQLLQDTLIKLANNESARRWLTKRAPLRAKDKEYDKPAWVVELLKTFGLTDTNTSTYWNGDTKIGYDIDYVPPMPMLSNLTSKKLKFPPVRKDYKSNEAFEKALKEYEDNEKQIKKENQEIIQNRTDRNWISVVKDFIMQAGHYNAVQDNKYKLYFGQLLLDDIEVYETRSDSHNKLRKQASLSNDENQKYKKSPDKNAREMYDNWLFRVIYDYYKQSQGIGGKIGNILQGFTSTSYMTINLRAGIANVLVGDASILGELNAKEYAAGKEWATSQLIWSHSILDFIANAYKDTASTKAGAVIKGMNIVDYSTLDGTITQVDMKKWSQIVNDLGFSINNAGEHLMQNGFMIAMMLSHRIIDNPNYGRPGEDKKICVNFAEYVANVREEIFREVATPKQIEEYETYVANIKHDANGAKNFAWFREDPISKYFANHHLSKEQIKEFKEKIDNRKKELKDEFEKAPTLWDNLDINDDGYMTFASGSILESINTIKPGKEISDAYKILGEFKGRVISVNKKIHGNYGKLDSAKIEKHWLGRLGTQYHKHLPTGIAKRYRREGYFNEERGTIEKGMYTSIWDFFKFPVEALRERNEIREDEAEALNGLKNIFAYMIDYFKYLAIYRNVMPDYERANLNRIKGNIVGVLVAIAGTLAARLAWDDDDESIAYNLLIYEADRLASEAAMYTPFGMISEGKKLWSAPIAGQSIVTDCINIISTICGVILEGEDYDPYYHTGRYAGRHKAGVYLERRIPYYRNYAMLRDISDSNHYYKLGSNILSFVPIDKIVNLIK